MTFERVLVTGAAGMVGRACRAELAKVGGRVRALQHATPVPFAGDGVEIVSGSLCDADSLAAALAGCDAVVHAAALLAGEDAALEAVNARGGARRLVSAARYGRILTWTI